MFKKKEKAGGIFDDLPVIQPHPSIQRETQKKSGRRAMLIPDQPAAADISSDQLAINTGKQKEEWLDIIYQSAQREAKQKAIATWLQDTYRLHKWWANSIALKYLAWREAPKSNAAGETVLRISKLIDATSFRVFTVLNSETIFGSDFKRFLKIVDSQRLVLSFQDETRATITFKTEGNSCEVLVEHEFIKDKEAIKARGMFWNQLLAQVASQVSR